MDPFFENKLRLDFKTRDASHGDGRSYLVLESTPHPLLLRLDPSSWDSSPLLGVERDSIRLLVSQTLHPILDPSHLWPCFPASEFIRFDGCFPAPLSSTTALHKPKAWAFAPKDIDVSPLNRVVSSRVGADTQPGPTGCARPCGCA